MGRKRIQVDPIGWKRVPTDALSVVFAASQMTADQCMMIGGNKILFAGRCAVSVALARDQMAFTSRDTYKAAGWAAKIKPTTRIMILPRTHAVQINTNKYRLRPAHCKLCMQDIATHPHSPINPGINPDTQGPTS